jgi:xanthine dehydrogenase accessory factor
MRDVLTTAAQLRSGAAPVALARMVSMQGFGGRRAGEALLIGTGGQIQGTLAMGAADSAVIVASKPLMNDAAGGVIRVTVPVGEDEAVAAGLACGGSADVLIQPLGSIPSELFAAVMEGVDVVACTNLTTGETYAVTTSSSNDAPSSVANAAHRLLTKGPATAQVVDDQWWLDPIIAVPVLSILGNPSALSIAIEEAGAMLGWDVTTYPESETATAVNAAQHTGPFGGTVVLSHDIAASSAVLAAALQGRCGFVGALGSRHTQTARADALRTTHGLHETTIARVRGPVGLDLGARTPEETALAIVAEMLAVTRNRGAAALTNTTGSING